MDRGGFFKFARNGVRICAVAFCVLSSAGAAGARSATDHVRQAIALETDGAYRAAAAELDAALDLIVDLGAAAAFDRAVLSVRRALLMKQAFERGDAVLAEIEAAANAALAAAAGHGPVEAEALALAGAAALVAGSYAAAADNARRALAITDPDNPCRRADRINLLARAELLARNTQRLPPKLDEPVPDTCLRETADERALLRGRSHLWRGDFRGAERALRALAEADDVTPQARASAFYNLAEVALLRGRYAEAEILNETARRGYADLGSDHPVFAQIDHRAAIIRQELGDSLAASRFYDRAIARLTDEVGPGHPHTLSVRREQVFLFADQGEFARARARAGEILAATTAPYERALATAAYGLTLYWDEPQSPAAKEALEKALSGFAAFPDSPLDQTPALVALAEIHAAAGAAAAARDHAERAIDILEDNGSASIQRLGHARRVLAEIEQRDGRPAEALELAQQNHETTLRQLRDAAALSTYAARFQPGELRKQVAQHVDLLWQEARADPDPSRLNAVFEAAQLVHLTADPGATAGLARGFLRLNPALAAVARDLGDVNAEITALERIVRIDPASDTAREARDTLAERRSRAAQIQAELNDMPGSATLRKILQPRARSLSEVRETLRDGRALWFHAAFDDFSLVALVTPSGARLARLPLREEALTELVREFRRGVTAVPGRLPAAEDFPVETAHRIYCALVAPLVRNAACADTAETFGSAVLELGIPLYIVPDRGMQEIAMAALPTAPVDAPTSFAALRETEWFGERHALTTLPSVAALPAEGRVARPATKREFVGFAPFGRRCPPAAETLAAAPAPTTPAAPGTLTAAILSSLHLKPIPGTARSVQRVAGQIGATEGTDWFRCGAASEAEAKRQNLDGVGTLMLASHAEVGDLPPGLTEPGLFFSVPVAPDAEDDGFLRASEIASLRMDVDLVILSACSTASNSGLPGAPGLSGLASAFFQAGARSLVVSHWDVASQSTARLTTALLNHRRDDPGIGADEALRRAMIDIMSAEGIPDYAHPFYWAPFVVVSG